MTTRRASSRLEMISISSPTSSCTRARNAAQLAARRQASVATWRRRRPCASELLGASPERVERALHRSIGKRAGRRQPFAEPNDAGEAVDDAEARRHRARTSSRQIFVPRSSAANWRAKGRRHAAVRGFGKSKGTSRSGRSAATPSLLTFPLLNALSTAS